MRFIQEHGRSWATGWSVWMVATLSLLAFFWALHEILAPEARGLGTLALLLAAPGAAADLLHDSLQATLIRDLARSADAATFSAWEGFMVMLGGTIVNLMYGLAGLAMTLGLRASGAPRWLVLQSLALWATTLALAGAGLTASPFLLVATTALTMAQFVLFAFVLAVHLRRSQGRLG